MAEDNGQIVGFSSGGKNRIVDDTEYDGELYAIYLLKEYQGKGIGRKLVKEVVNGLKEKHYKSMMVWVLQLNSSIDFYRKLGGIEFSEKQIKIGDDLLTEVALGWNNIHNINL